MGLAGGWLFVRMPEEIKINHILVKLGWTIVLATNLIIFFAQTFRVENRYLGMVFMAICRPLWALTIVWMIIMCSKGYGGENITYFLNN